MATITSLFVIEKGQVDERFLLVKEGEKSNQEDGGGQDPAGDGPHHADRVGLPVDQVGDVGC